MRGDIIDPMNVVGPVTVSSGTVTVSSGTVTATPAPGLPYALVSAATTNAAVIKGAPGSVHEITIANPTATAAFVKLYDKATAPTVGTDVPLVTVPAPANSLQALNLGALGKRFPAGIAIAITGAITAADTTAAVAGVQVSATYL